MTIVPRKPQALAITAAVPALRKHKRALVVLATAIGKTITSALIARKLKSKRVLFLVHNNFILENSVKEYQKVFGESRTYALYNGLSKEGATTADFVFASFQTMIKNLRFWKRSHFDLIVVDESHHAQAESYRRVVEYFTGSRLGITATPDRMDLLDIRKLFGEEVISISLEEAIAKGWLPRIEYHVVTDDGFDEEALTRISQEVLRENRRISMDELNRRVFIRARDKKVASIIEGYDEKTLIFCRNITHADNFKTFLKLSATFHSQTGNHAQQTWDKNQKVLQALRDGLLLRVLAVNAFNEGVDVPSIGLVVFLRTTDSDTIFRQQLGRGCRPDKEKLVVLDFVGNVQRIMMLQKMRDTIAQIHEQSTSSADRAAEGYERDALHLSGRGFEFTFSDKIVDLMKVIDRIRADLYPTWQEAEEAAVMLGIDSYTQYKERYKEDQRLPVVPEYKYLDFPGWRVFLAKPELYATWQEASRVALKLGITVKDSYPKLRKGDEKLPGSPDSKYEDFPGWRVFLGRSDLYATWQEASRAALELGVTSWDNYRNKHKEDSKLPSDPASVYDNFPGWYKFLGKKSRKLYPTWQEASRATVRIGFVSQADYQKRYKEEDDRLPGDPGKYPGFPGWSEYLGKPAKNFYPSLIEASKAARKLGITTKESYGKLRKKDTRLTAVPGKVYPNFPGWKQFLSM